MVIKKVVTLLKNRRARRKTQEGKELQARDDFRTMITSEFVTLPSLKRRQPLTEFISDIQRAKQRIHHNRTKLLSLLTSYGVDAISFKNLTEAACLSPHLFAKRWSRALASSGILYVYQLQPPFTKEETVLYVIYALCELHAGSYKESLRMYDALLIVSEELLSTKINTRP